MVGLSSTGRGVGCSVACRRLSIGDTPQKAQRATMHWPKSLTSHLLFFVHTTYVVRGIGLGHFRYSFYMPLRWSVHAFIYCLCVCPDTWLQTKLTQHFQVLTFGYFDTHALCQSAHWLSANLHHEQFHVVDARSSCLSNEPWYCCTLCLSVGRSGKKLCASLIRHGWNSILWIMSLVSIYLQRCSLC